MALELSETKSTSPLGSLPPGWKLVKLQEITTKIGTGATPRGGEKVYLSTRKNFALIRSQHVFDRYLKSEGIAFISDEHAAELQNVWVQACDLLLNITGDGITFARACLVPENILPACVNQHVAIIRLDKSQCVPGYLLSYLTHPLIKEYIESFNSGGSRRAITKGHIESFVIPLPPLPEQKAIAHILGTLDDKIELNREMNRTLEAMAQAIFKSWFVDFDPVRAKMEGRLPAGMDAATAELFPDELKESPLGMIPKSWDIKLLPDAIDVNPSRRLAKSEIAPYLDMANMPTQGHRPDNWINRTFSSGTKFINGDTLLARITPCLENGKTAFVDFLEDEQLGWGSTEYIILRPKPPLPVEYGYYLARSDEFRTFAIQNMTGSSGRQRVPNECFSQYFLALPSQKIAKLFADIVKSLMARISSNSEESRTLISIRNTLILKLLSG
ncbi:restriction endonuclease subunit S [Nostoc sp.]|uniref:restriction endonuclease subunit S n=1 Tax=Nostoc sp. TaxID=1180 RepID=UPI002FFC1604